MMRIILILITAVVVTACGAAGRTTAGDDRVQVVAAFAPLAEAAARVGGDDVAVTDLTPPGVEPHDLELRPSDLASLGEADLILYLGGGFQPALEEAVTQVEGMAVDLLTAAGTLQADPEGELDADPHVWLDPGRFRSIVDATALALASVDPGNTELYRANAAEFDRQLSQLDQDFAEGLAACQHLLVTGHEAFGYLAAAYGLEQVGVAGVSPEAEPTPDRLAQIRDLVEREGVTTVYAEDLLSPDAVEAIARETGAAVSVLDPVESARSDGSDYVSRMRANLDALRTGLRC
jgi:zinc transport system substrate-binding protein